MSSIVGVGSSPGNVQGLTNAFNSADKLVDTSTGTLGGPSLASGAVLPERVLNTLADILAACVNSAGGVAGDTSVCGKLFSATTVNGIAPTDTITAAMNIAQHPGSQINALLKLVGTAPAFLPTLSSAPSSFALVIRYTGASLAKPAGIAVDATGQIWMPNSSNDTLTILSQSGSPIAGSPFSGNGLNGPSGVAVDASGTGWIANRAGDSLSSFTGTGAIAYPVQTTGALNFPSALAIDPAGDVWVANYGSSSVTEFSGTGNVLGIFSTPATTATGIAIDPQ
jgi:streptogramin lyase